MDITNLTSQITSLRSETQERSITPERVGSLLQQLANLIKNTDDRAATQDDIYEINDNAVSNMRVTVTPTANGATIRLSLIELDGEEFDKIITLPVASTSSAGIISAADYAAFKSASGGNGNSSGSGMTEEERSILNSLASHFVKIGGTNVVWVTSHDAELEAAKLERCADPDIWFMYYYVRGSKYGLIEQNVCDDTCIQTLRWDSTVKQRVITFSDTDRTAISNVGDWTELHALTASEFGQFRNAAGTANASFTAGESSQKKKYKIWLTLHDVSGNTAAEYDVDIPLASSETMGVMSAADKVKLDGMPDSSVVAADNFGIRFLGNVGAASSVGEEQAATVAIAGNVNVKWIVYTYSSYTAIIHQTHNSTTTVQDMFFAGNRLSRRTITFTNAERTAISSVGAWTSVGTDIGVSRSATTATIKMPHPFMENTAGLLSLVIGQANTSLAGLMTADNLRTLNYVYETVNTMFETLQDQAGQITELNSKVESLQGQIDNLANIYVKQSKLHVFASPMEINIPVVQTSSNGGTVKSNVEQVINLTAVDENENAVDAMDCSVTWQWGNENASSIFSIEHETEKRYVTFYANEGDTWAGNQDGTVKLTLTNLNNNVSGEVTINLKRVTNAS